MTTDIDFTCEERYRLVNIEIPELPSDILPPITYPYILSCIINANEPKTIIFSYNDEIYRERKENYIFNNGESFSVNTSY